jgi:PKD repeat protein
MKFLSIFIVFLFSSSLMFSQSFTCGSSITIEHSAGNVAPVSKTVTYGTVTFIPGDSSKCWITSNLGADHQASAVDDATEPSAGWYWQFNRMQGYNHDGTARTPDGEWITEINENFDWQAANDPCALELGSGWRIPTLTEWSNVVSAGEWTDWNGPWNSDLKIHAAGLLSNLDGSLAFRGQNGYYWSSSHSTNAQAWDLYFYNEICYMNGFAWKPYGLTIRCLIDEEPLGFNSDFSAYPLEGVSPLNVQFTDESTGTPTIWKWDFQNDGIYDTFIQNPSFTYIQSGIYSVKLLVQNAAELDSVIKVDFITVNQPTDCGESISVSHIAGNVAPVNKMVTYGIVTNIPGEPAKCWITQNLGADHQASAPDDVTEAAAGWYWQFNRMQGYKHDGTTRTPDGEWITEINENFDWQAVNDPCLLELGNGWRLPTLNEWYNVSTIGEWENWNGPWNSSLKIHAAGHLLDSEGDLTDRGEWGFYWGSSQRYDHTNGYYLRFSADYCGDGFNYNSKAYGFSIRCIKDEGSVGLNSNFSATPLEGQAPLIVQFTDGSTGNPTVWKWDFQNDGIYDSFIQDPIYTYYESGEFNVKLVVENSTESDTLLIINYISVNLAPPEICIVSVTPEQHNQVIWEKQTSDQIDSYNIYRETTQADIYEVVGTVSYGDSSIFADESSIPKQRAYKYKLSSISVSGVETALSSYHKTIHLTINEAPDGWNLIWSPYEGFPYSTYYIYRGFYADSMALFDSISSGFTSYTDIEPPLGPLYYAIEVVREGGCNPSKSEGYDRSRSNTMFSGEVGLDENPETGFIIYPNPAHDNLYILLNRSLINLNTEVIICDMYGKALTAHQIESEETIISIDSFKPGIYIIQVRDHQTLLTRKLIIY